MRGSGGREPIISRDNLSIIDAFFLLARARNVPADVVDEERRELSYWRENCDNYKPAPRWRRRTHCPAKRRVDIPTRNSNELELAILILPFLGSLAEWETYARDSVLPRYRYRDRAELASDEHRREKQFRNFISASPPRRSADNQLLLISLLK